MRILGHIHTLDDDNVIDQSLGAVMAQTRPLDGVVIVDNGSSDGTLRRVFPAGVTVIRHATNLGTSGSVVTGMKHALANGYDWIWLFDADTAPRKDALERLLGLYRGLAPEIQERTWLVSSLPIDIVTGRSLGGMVFDARGAVELRPEPGSEPYEFDASIWTGCLFKLEAVRRVGLPTADYMLDWGEYAYGYRGKRAGFRAFMNPRSVVDHNIDGQVSMRVVRYGVGPVEVKLLDLPPIRCYYLIRNMVYFWLYEFEPKRLGIRARKLAKALLITTNFLVRPLRRRAELVACLRGLRDGFRGDLQRRY